MRRRLIHTGIAATVLTCFVHAQNLPVPADAPTSACEFSGARTLDNLRVFTGSAPVPFVFSCPAEPGGRCNLPLKPGSKERLSSTVIGVDRTERTWSCVFADGVSGWVPSDRLAPLPETPAIPIADWLGWWRSGPDQPHMQNDRLLITRSPSNPHILHVSGRAYWYGLGDNVHFGQINADAQARGPFLHIVEGDLPGCVLDLTYDPATHTFNAVDNAMCGGMNVRFTDTWTRFTPKASPRK